MIDEIDKKRKQSVEEQLERERELEEAERKKKEAKAKEQAEQLQREEEEKAEEERREKLKRMSRFGQWEEDRLKQLEPKSDLWDSYDFSAAVTGLGQLDVVTPVSRGADVDNSDDDIMLSYRVKRRRVSFEGTSKRVLKYINKTLESYRDDYWEPELEIGLPVCTTDCPEMDIREKIPMPTADEQGYFPGHDDVLEECLKCP